MLESVRKNKKYIFTVVTVGLFGIMGLLIVPVVRYIIKVVLASGDFRHSESD